MPRYIGIEIGGTKIQVVIGDENASIIQRERFSVSLDKGADGIKDQIRAAIERSDLEGIVAVGVGFGGPVNPESGVILASHQVKGWSGFRFSEWLREIISVPVFIDNDANVAALGESLFGAGTRYSQIFYTTLGSGVGAGYVVDGSIFHSSKNVEAEFGHIRLDKSGRTVESSCSGWAVDERVRRLVRENPSGLLASLASDLRTGEAKVLGSAIADDDSAARTILEETADDLAFAYSHVVHLLNPEAIILGGGLSMVGEPLRKLVETKLTGYLMSVLQPGADILLSQLKEDVVPIGALTLAIRKHSTL